LLAGVWCGLAWRSYSHRNLTHAAFK